MDHIFLFECLIVIHPLSINLLMRFFFLLLLSYTGCSFHTESSVYHHMVLLLPIPLCGDSLRAQSI